MRLIIALKQQAMIFSLKSLRITQAAVKNKQTQVWRTLSEPNRKKITIFISKICRKAFEHILLNAVMTHAKI